MTVLNLTMILTPWDKETLMAEGCMSHEAIMTRGQQAELVRRIAASLQTDRDWERCSPIAYLNYRLNLQVFAVDPYNITIYDMGDGYPLLRAHCSFWSRKKHPVRQIWEWVHLRRHVEVEASGQAILDRFEPQKPQNKSLPESITRSLEVVG